MRIFLEGCSSLHHAGERQSLTLTFLSDHISELTQYPAASMYGVFAGQSFLIKFCAEIPDALLHASMRLTALKISQAAFNEDPEGIQWVSLRS